jgi:hypothetical protein
MNSSTIGEDSRFVVTIYQWFLCAVRENDHQDEEGLLVITILTGHGELVSSNGEIRLADGIVTDS